MGNKRKQQKVDKIAKKIKKLEKKLQRLRRVISSDDNDSEMEVQVLPSPRPSRSPTPLRSPTASPVPQTSSYDLLSQEATTIGTDRMEPGPSVQNKMDTSNQEEEPVLEDDILQILGEAPQLDSALGKNTHKDIASRWQDILQKGLSKDVKDSVTKKYLIPANCHFLVAPILNPEAKAAVPDILSKRDNTIMQKQNQIGIALAALSHVSEMILRNETSKQALLQPLSDACRILCDSHHIETKTRRSILLSSMNTNIREGLANANRDKYLFGEDFAEKLRVAKTVQKTGESLVKANPVSNRNSNQGNTKRNLNFRAPIPRKPPRKTNESTRGRPSIRLIRSSNYTRHQPPPPKASSPTRRNYRR